MSIFLLLAGVALVIMGALLFMVKALYGAFSVLFGFLLIGASFSYKKQQGQKKSPSASPAPSPRPSVPSAPSDLLFFKLNADPGAEVLFKKIGVMNEDYSLSRSELISEGATDMRIYKYEEIEEVPEIKEGAVYLEGVLVGQIKRNDRRKVEELISSGSSFTVGIYGGPYKRIIEDWDDEKAKEIYEMETDETPVSATLRIKK